MYKIDLIRLANHEISLILLACNLLMLAYYTVSTKDRERARSIGVFTVVYAAMSLGMWYMARQFLITRFMTVTQMAVAFALCCYSFRGILKDRGKMRPVHLVFFLACVFVVVYLTVVERCGANNDTGINLNPASLFTLPAEMVVHFWMNALLFIPHMAFLVFMQTETDRSLYRYALPFGLIFSTLIEGMQLLLQLGQCDINDITGNTLGALMGIGCALAYRRWQGGAVYEKPLPQERSLAYGGHDWKQETD